MWREGGVKQGETISSGAIHSFHCPWKKSFFPFALTPTGATVLLQLLKKWGQVPLLMQIPLAASCHSQYGQLHFLWKQHREPRWARVTEWHREMEFNGSDCEMLLKQWRGTAHMDPPNPWVAPVVFHWKDANKSAQCRFSTPGIAAWSLSTAAQRSEGKISLLPCQGPVGEPCLPPLSSRFPIKGKKILPNYPFTLCFQNLGYKNQDWAHQITFGLKTLLGLQSFSKS